MESKMPEIRYTRLFEADMIEAVDYITQVLNNPMAAERLVADVEKGILERAACADSFEPYATTHKRPDPYYRIYIRNYTVFYVVIDGVMEIRRFLYSASNLPKKL